MRHFLLLLTTLLLTAVSIPKQALAQSDHSKTDALSSRTLTLGMLPNDASFVSLKVLQAAYERIGVKIIPSYMPGLRSLRESDQGHLDGEVCRVREIEKDNPNLIRIPEKVDSFTVIAVTTNPDIRIGTIDDIKPLRIGIRNGVVFANDFISDSPNVTAKPEWDHLFDLLAMGRLDVLITTPHTARQQKSRLPRDTTIHETVLAQKDLYHYLHKKHEKLIPIITSTLKTMNENGDREDIRLNSMGKPLQTDGQ